MNNCHTRTIGKLLESKAQSLVETALALPIALLLFAGCIQLLQIGIAHMVVYIAAYESARQVHMDQGDLVQGRQIAMEICRSLGSGTTTLTVDPSQTYRVTHKLKPIFMNAKDMTITHFCPSYIFKAGEGMTNATQTP